MLDPNTPPRPKAFVHPEKNLIVIATNFHGNLPAEKLSVMAADHGTRVTEACKQIQAGGFLPGVETMQFSAEGVLVSLVYANQTQHLQVGEALEAAQKAWDDAFDKKVLPVQPTVLGAR